MRTIGEIVADAFDVCNNDSSMELEEWILFAEVSKYCERVLSVGASSPIDEWEFVKEIDKLPSFGYDVKIWTIDEKILTISDEGKWRIIEVRPPEDLDPDGAFV